MSAGRHSEHHIHTQQCPKPEDRIPLFLVLYKVQEVFLKASPPTPASLLADSTHIPLARIVSPVSPETNQGKKNGVSIGYTNEASSPGVKGDSYLSEIKVLLARKKGH